MTTLEWWRGTTASWSLRLQGTDGAPADLSGTSARALIGAGAACATLPLKLEEGAFVLRLDASVPALTAGRHRVLVQIDWGDGWRHAAVLALDVKETCG